MFDATHEKMDISGFIDEIILKYSTNWADHLIRLIDSQAIIMDMVSGGWLSL